MRVKYFASEHNTMAWPGLNPESLHDVSHCQVTALGTYLLHVYNVHLHFLFFLTLLAIVVHDQA